LNEVERGSRPWLDWLARVPELLPALVALGVFIFWTLNDGGVFPTDSYPGALILLGLLAATTYAFRGQLPSLPPAVIAAIALLAGFVLWNFLSITWADDQGAAWDGANRCLLYLTVFSLFALPRWSGRTGAWVIGLYSLACALIAGITLLGAAASSDPLGYMIADRLSSPTGYYNANAALFTIAGFPAVLLASRGEVPWPIRGVMLASAGVLFDFALLPQSRGWLIVAPLALVAYLILTPQRVRSLIVLAPLAIVTALSAPTMLDVFDNAGKAGQPQLSLDHARNAMLVGAAVLFVAGSVIGFVDSRLELSARTRTIGGRLVGGIAWVGGIIGVIVAIAVIGNPATWARDRWDDFKHGESPAERTGGAVQGSRLTQGIGSNRYDFWRVAVDDFRDSPLTGVGSENYAEDYVRDRHSTEEPTHPHSLPLRILAQTGLIGALLFAGFLIAAVVGVARVRLRSPTPLSRGVAGVTLVVLVYWLLHASGDWFWAFPAISAPIFAWLGLGMRLDAVGAPATATAAAPVTASQRRAGWMRPAAIAACAVAVVAAVSLFLPWAAAVDVKKASESWGADPQAAFDRLDQARDLNFLSAQPDLTGGAIASRLGDLGRMRSYFSQALERDPRNWYATLELGALDGIQGDRQAALQRLARVAQLNPREPLTARVRRGIVSGHPVMLRELDAAFTARYCARLGRTPSPNGGCAA
jgi:O-antigen ligase/polysaccharide polymerase Wzy-like membrane protein